MNTAKSWGSCPARIPAQTEFCGCTPSASDGTGRWHATRGTEKASQKAATGPLLSPSGPLDPRARPKTAAAPVLPILPQPVFPPVRIVPASFRPAGPKTGECLCGRKRSCLREVTVNGSLRLIQEANAFRGNLQRPGRRLPSSLQNAQGLHPGWGPCYKHITTPVLPADRQRAWAFASTAAFPAGSAGHAPKAAPRPRTTVPSGCIPPAAAMRFSQYF